MSMLRYNKSTTDLVYCSGVTAVHLANRMMDRFHMVVSIDATVESCPILSIVTVPHSC